MRDGQAPPRALLFGCAGLTLSEEERAFFRAADPLGFILFSRNCGAPDQIRALVAGLRDAVNRADAPILIDQEGGRVQRLRPPHWREAPPSAAFGRLAACDLAAARQASYFNAWLIGSELAALGVSVDCAPVLDLAFPGAHEVIGERAFDAAPEIVAELGRAACEGLLAAGILPVVKHIPGHGRALADSHHHLPVVEATRRELEETDFLAFRRLSDMPWAMTAHIVYRAIDPVQPITLSKTGVDQIIRGWIGFDGVLVSDDLSMAALDGALGERAARALAAGCDLALHCNGRLDEMREVAAAVSPLSSAAIDRLARGAARLGPSSVELDPVSVARRLDVLLASR
jgi:beta-N-acetylhexosaminidase